MLKDKIKELEIIDLEDDLGDEEQDMAALEEDALEECEADERPEDIVEESLEEGDVREEEEVLEKEEDLEETEDSEEGDKPKSRFRQMYVHLAFGGILVAIVIFLIVRFQNWGVLVDLEDFFSKNEVEYSEETMDKFFPARDANGNIVEQKDSPTILFLGNSPFADERDSETGIVNLIQQHTGGVVYNCAISGSYSCVHDTGDITSVPMDAFNAYMLLGMQFGSYLQGYVYEAREALGEDAPAELDEVIHTMESLDYSTIDVVALMYDVSDYYLGFASRNVEVDDDMETVSGSLVAFIRLLKQKNPAIRIIVMSPTFAYTVNEQGEYVSVDKYIYNESTYSQYMTDMLDVVYMEGVTFVDNYYNTINEDNADQYLEDHLHLNEAGRRLVAERFIYALDYYKNADYVPSEN